MVLWWIGNAILLLVVVPVLVALLNRVLAALERIRGASDQILAGGVATLQRTRFVLIELNNHNLYKNTCQYYEVDEFLRSHSFKLADIIVTYRGDDGVSEYDALYRNLNL